MSLPSTVNPSAPRWFAALAAVALMGYAIFLGIYFAPFAGGSDSSGYLNAAQLLARGQLTAPQRDFAGLTGGADTQFQPLGFIAEPARARLVPTYPLGLPAHLAVAGTLFGWALGPLIVGVGATLAAMLLLYAVARELALAWPLAAAGAIMFGVFPVTLFIAVQPLSDVLATTWILAAIFAALRARTSLRWAAAAGLAFAVAVFVRPTNILLFPVLVVTVGVQWRQLVAVVFGGLPGALALLACNAHLYGSPWRMGYGSIFEAFAGSYFFPTMLHFGKWLGALLPALILGLACISLAGVRSRARELTALALWFLVPVLFYAFYEISHEVWWCLRFILPAVPALILAGLIGLQRLLQSRLALLTTGAAVLSLWAVMLSVYWTRHFHTLLSQTYERAYAELGHWAHDQLPANAVLLANNDSGALYYYTPFPILRWDQMSPSEFTHHAAHLTRAARPLYLVAAVDDEAHILGERVPARWNKIATVAQRSIWRYDGPASSAVKP